MTGFSYGLLATHFAPVNCRSTPRKAASFLVGRKQRGERRVLLSPSEAHPQQPNLPSLGPVPEVSSVSERCPRLKDESLTCGLWGHLRSHPGTFLPWQAENGSWSLS